MRAPDISFGITLSANKGFHIGSRGVSMYGELLYSCRPIRIWCAEREGRHGEVECRVADAARGYWTTMSPLIIPQSCTGRRLGRLR